MYAQFDTLGGDVVLDTVDDCPIANSDSCPCLSVYDPNTLQVRYQQGDLDLIGGHSYILYASLTPATTWSWTLWKTTTAPSQTPTRAHA